MSIQVDIAGGGGDGVFPVEVFTGPNKTLIVADNLKFHLMNSAVAQTITLQGNAAFPIGAEMEFLREGAGTVTFAVSGGAVLHSRNNLVSINARYSAVSLKKMGANEWRLIGDLA